VVVAAAAAAAAFQPGGFPVSMADQTPRHAAVHFLQLLPLLLLLLLLRLLLVPLLLCFVHTLTPVMPRLLLLLLTPSHTLKF